MAPCISAIPKITACASWPDKVDDGCAAVVTPGMPIHCPALTAAGLGCLLTVLLGPAATASHVKRRADGWLQDLCRRRQGRAGRHLVLYSTDPEAPAEPYWRNSTPRFPRSRRLSTAAGWRALCQGDVRATGQAYLADVISPPTWASSSTSRSAAASPVYLARDGGLQAGVQEHAGRFLDLGRADHRGIAYNPKLVPEPTRRRTGRTRWTRNGRTRSRSRCPTPACSTWSGTCCAALRQGLLAEARPLKPHAFDSYVQQFDRLVNGQDKVALTAQYSGYLILKAKGAPVEFVFPPMAWWRRRALGHHQGRAASRGGEALSRLVPRRRRARPPTPGAVLQLAAHRRAAAARRRELNELKLLFPHDWHDFEQTHTQFVREWDKITGLR